MSVANPVEPKAEFENEDKVDEDEIIVVLQNGMQRVQQS
jgi:hypothetical protein